MAVSNCSKYFHRMLKSIAETPFVRSLGREDASLGAGVRCCAAHSEHRVNTRGAGTANTT